MGVNYSPVFSAYSGVAPFRYWCQKVLPLVYDDSLSYYELLNKVVDYLNNVISDVSNVEANLDNLLSAYNQLQDYVNEYFDNLDVQNEINNKLDEMVLDGSLNEIIDPVVIDAVGDWLEENITATTPAVDDTLSVENAAAEAKATGEAIWHTKTHSSNQPRVMTRFTGGASISDVLEMPDWSYFQQKGTTLQSKLGSGFTDTLSGADYIIYRMSYQNFGTTNGVFLLTVLGGGSMWWGYQTTVNEQYTIVWTRIDARSVLNNFADSYLYRNRGIESNAHLLPMLQITTTEYNGYSKLTDMPSMSYHAAIGSEITAIDAENIPELANNVTHYIFRLTTTINNSGSMFLLSTLSGSKIWVGYNLNDSDTVTWICVYDKNKNDSETAQISQLNSENANRRFVYTFDESELITGFWDASGMANTFSHTPYIRVTPGERIYTGFLVNQDVSGIWADENFTRVGSILKSNYTKYDYELPNGTGNHQSNTASSIGSEYENQNYRYAPIYYITVPSGAFYASFNANTLGTQYYRMYVANFPIFYFNDGSKLDLYPGDKFYNEKKNKKLLVIGPSTVMIDRRREDWTQSEDSATYRFTIGFQEYLVPYYKEVFSLGYSGYGWGNQENHSIYKELTDANIDWTDYDEFLLMSSVNEITHTGIGDWGSYESYPPYPNGSVSAMSFIARDIISAFATAEKEPPNIYITTGVKGKRFADDEVRQNVPGYASGTTDRQLIEDQNTQIKELSDGISIKCIDLFVDSGENFYNYYYEDNPFNGYTYDGTHWNNVGSKRIGEAIRRAIVGV